MQLIADLHIHSRFSRACSKDITIKNLEKYARIKGINILGTGDFTHPIWFKELKQELKEDNSGILKTQSGFQFVLQTEVSNFFRYVNQPRKVHNVILAKNFEIVSQINELFSKHGKLASDGRPMFASYPCVDMVEDLMEIDKSIEIIPAHALTPWFGVFGSNSGFNSLEECFSDKTKYIHAVETGMSADPKMLWRLPFLDKITLVSNSDSHSYWPWRLGREANLFDIEPTYQNIINAIRTKQGLKATIEVDPNYGKYHFDGHRLCNISYSPEESIKHSNICPKCKRPLTIGVAHRIEELATRKDGYKPLEAVDFYSLIPLFDLISIHYKTSGTSKKAWEIFNKLLQQFKSEFNVLLNAEEQEIAKITDSKFASIIILNRFGKIQVKAGYDGVYGIPIIDGVEYKVGSDDPIKPEKPKAQKTLGEF